MGRLPRSLKPNLQVRQMKMLSPLKVEQEFTDDRLTGFGGCSALASMARHLDLFRALADAVRVKSRCRGPSDSATLWALIASLASGGGALSDLDALRSDPTACKLLGLRDTPANRRMGEFLAKVSEPDVNRHLGAARKVAKRIAPTVIEHEIDERGYVPVFVDGTEIEVGGELFEGASRSCGVHAAHGWKGQLESDVDHLLPEGTPSGLGRTTTTTPNPV